MNFTKLGHAYTIIGRRKLGKKITELNKNSFKKMLK